MTLPRRSPRTALLSAVVAAVLVLTGCTGGSPDTDPTASAPGRVTAGGWSYRDATGTTVRLDRAPRRIVAVDEVAIALLRYGLHPVGTFGRSPVATSPDWEGLDTDGVEDLGDGPLDPARVAALDPDLVITSVYPVDAKGRLPSDGLGTGFTDDDQRDRVVQAAPVAAVRWGGDGEDVLAEVAALATSIGAEQSTVDAAERTFDTAAEALRAETDEHRVQLTALYADHDGVYVARPADDPMLRLYTDHGVDLRVPGPGGFYWGVYSWPNAGKVRGDVFLVARQGYQAAELLEQPTIADAPALVAGQVHPWVSDAGDYVSQATAMDQLRGWIADSQPVS